MGRRCMGDGLESRMLVNTSIGVRAYKLDIAMHQI